MNKVEAVVKQMSESQEKIETAYEIQAAHYETVLCIGNLQILLERALKDGKMEEASVFSGCIQELEKVEAWLLRSIEE